ncbi:acetylornithine transaminase [Georgenia subflava]|uniref:Acetylornithine aminotransferase n=1 Tax=Georgenia subflava TaxID=1622177 RepID=A0A6N7EMM0_9MICO|nr:acetylornithine transaminase [Georgenia subflava]MPV38378.1 acetylornithine transaminase [Georgenia subflava]
MTDATTTDPTTGSATADQPAGPVAGATTDQPAGPVAGATTDQPTGAGWTERYRAAVMNTFGDPQRVLVRGEGAWVWDADGNRYLDLLGGIAVNALGHAHPALVAAVAEQLGTLGHVSNFFTTPAQVTLAEKLLELVAPGGAPAGSRVFLANSGTEANEGALKLARRHGGPARPRVLALEGAFHGRTLGALSLTHKAAYREPFEPLPGGVEFLPFGDLDALEAALGDDVAALFLEPVQGEAGVRTLPAGYLARARELTTAVGALLVLDEVQSGMGRTGRWMAHHGLDGGAVVPDVVTLAKGLGGGLPIGAVVALGEHAATLLGPGQHGTTFGGNPVAAAAALAVIDVIEREGLLGHVTRTGATLREQLSAVDGVTEVRGEGLLVAVVLDAPVAKAAAAALLEAGFIVNPVREDTLRLAPPLVLTAEQGASLVAALPAALGAARDVAPA